MICGTVLAWLRTAIRVVRLARVDARAGAFFVPPELDHELRAKRPVLLASAETVVFKTY